MLRLDKTVASPGTIASGLTPYAVDASGFDVKDNAASYPPWEALVFQAILCDVFEMWCMAVLACLSCGQRSN